MINRRAGAKGTEGGAADRGRWSSRRKTDVVLRLVRGEDLDSVSRELGVGAAEDVNPFETDGVGEVCA
jgi:hypothetical protein